jgi:hypothetical protein
MNNQDPRPDVLKAEVLRAMGFRLLRAESPFGAEFCYTPRPLTAANIFDIRKIYLDTWHPADSLDDAALVETWLRGKGAQWQIDLANALTDVLEQSAQDGLYLNAIFATVAERWEACLAVMREAGLIPQGE